MILMMKGEAVRQDARDNVHSDAAITISHFALALQHEKDDAPDAPKRIAAQISRIGDEASVDLIGLAVSRAPIPELTILAAHESDDGQVSDPTRIIFRNARIEAFVTQVTRESASLSEDISISAETLIYEYGTRRFDGAQAS